ncbi:MAG TPA: hypothetical protein VH186_23240, partial [Chloroflexia bacterium]|nr:hypothetical protein [Chloroflexia bacterium]
MRIKRLWELRPRKPAFYISLALIVVLLTGALSTYFLTQPASSISKDKEASNQINAGEDEENDADAVKADGPQELIDWEFNRQRNAKNIVPADGIKKAVAQAKRLPKAHGTALPNTAGATPGSWQWLGPGNVGGRIRSILVNPANTSIIYIGAVAGGVWKSSDGGQSWQILNDFLPNMAVSSLVMDPSDTTGNTIYAGTGEGYYNSDGIRGNGIFKTTDGGANWSQLDSTNNANFYYVTHLDFSPD